MVVIIPTYVSAPADRCKCKWLTEELNFPPHLNGASGFQNHCILQEDDALFSLQLFHLTTIGWINLSSFVFTPGDSIQLGPETILWFMQPSRVVQHDAETAPQTPRDEHPAFYSSAYIYKFMEHLVKKMLPKIPLQVCQVILVIHWQMLAAKPFHSWLKLRPCIYGLFQFLPVQQSPPLRPLGGGHVQLNARHPGGSSFKRAFKETTLYKENNAKHSRLFSTEICSILYIVA